MGKSVPHLVPRTVRAWDPSATETPEGPVLPVGFHVRTQTSKGPSQLPLRDDWSGPLLSSPFIFICMLQTSSPFPQLSLCTQTE